MKLILGICMLAAATGVLAQAYCIGVKTLGGGSNMIKAAKAGDVPELAKLIESGADVDERSPESGATALFYASGYEHLDAVRFLVEKGASVNARDKDGKTPLFANVNNDRNSVEILKLLLANGADIQAKDKFGMNALFYALDPGGTRPKVKFLIEKGIYLNVLTDDKRDFPLRRAADWSDLETVKTLLEHGANPNLRTKDGMTALMVACAQGNPDVIKELLNHGADSQIADDRGRRAIDFIRQENQEIRYMLQ